ncbi:hypothetical protein KTU01_28090 [Kocuria turfanensis]|uniref:Uncharacterized protein n=1 Tax=Kocuria turfanensis TaxID=388357 RepID=A0A512IG53_9MICC|nr:hypothetical protein KTU01_28090 [Kocuria turfanensis]
MPSSPSAKALHRPHGQPRGRAVPGPQLQPAGQLLIHLLGGTHQHAHRAGEFRGVDPLPLGALHRVLVRLLRYITRLERNAPLRRGSEAEFSGRNPVRGGSGFGRSGGGDDTFLNIRPDHPRLEIGSTWLAPRTRAERPWAGSLLGVHLPLTTPIGGLAVILCAGRVRLTPVPHERLQGIVLPVPTRNSGSAQWPAALP